MQHTPEQAEILRLGRETNESFIIDAKAGSGKTKTLLDLLATALTGSTLLMAFNKAIAEECKQRASALLSFERGLEVSISTVHSHGLAAFRKAGSRPATNSGKVAFLVKDILEAEADRDDDIWRNKAAISRLVSYAKAAGFGLSSINERFPAIADEHAWMVLIEHYGMEEDLQGSTTAEELARYARIALAQSNRRLNMIDFDDMIYLPLLLNMSIPTYENVLIDEAQDINATRRELAFRSMKPGGRLIAVGDPNQAIYGFTGADALSLENIGKRIGHEVRTMPLSICWRCDGRIIKEAQQIVPDIRCRPGSKDLGLVKRIPFIGDLQTARNQAAALFEAKEPVFAGEMRAGAWDHRPEVQNRLDLFTLAKPGDAILCRLNKPNVATCLGFLRRGKRAKIEGRDLGKRLEYHATRANDAYAFETCEQTLLSMDLYEEQQIGIMVSKNRSEASIAFFQDEVDATKLILERCIEARADAGWTDFQALLADLFGDDVSNASTITLASVHKSKGREWPRVFILGRSDYMPFHLAKQEWEVEQEHNLIYVAITRAEKELFYVTDVQSAIDKGLHREVKPTPRNAIAGPEGGAHITASLQESPREMYKDKLGKSLGIPKPSAEEIEERAAAIRETEEFKRRALPPAINTKAPEPPLKLAPIDPMFLWKNRKS